MYLDHEMNCTGDISLSCGQPNTRVHVRTTQAPHTPRSRGGDVHVFGVRNLSVKLFHVPRCVGSAQVSSSRRNASVPDFRMNLTYIFLQFVMYV